MGWIITLCILVLLAVLPLGAAIRYDTDGFSLKLIAGPVRIPILSGKQKDPDAKNNKKKKSKNTDKDKTTKAVAEKNDGNPKEKGGSITDFLPIVKTALQLLNCFRKKLRIKQLQLKLVLAGDDPCDLGINYGRANAAMGNLLPQLERCFTIKKRNIEVGCDFESSQTLIIARADVTITLGWLLAMVVFYAAKAIKQYFTIKNKRKGGASL